MSSKWFPSLRHFLTGAWRFQRTVVLKDGPVYANIDDGHAVFGPLPAGDIELIAHTMCNKPHGQSLVTPVMTGPDSFNSMPHDLIGTLRNALLYSEHGTMTFASGLPPVEASNRYLYLFPPPFATVAEVRAFCKDPADHLDYLYKMPFPTDLASPVGTAEYVLQHTKFNGKVEIEDAEWFNSQWEVEGPGSHCIVRTMYGKINKKKA
jgi:hypothetical protein